MENWMQTYTVKRVDILIPSVEVVCIEDIAHHLSHLCRYCGAVREFYSVAQHSVLVSRMVPPEHALWGLLHDASEAYLGDVQWGVKRWEGMIDYRNLEVRWQAVIAERFGLPLEEPWQVRAADKQIVATEARDLFPRLDPAWTPHIAGAVYLSNRIVGWGPGHAESRFLQRFRELTA